MHSEIISSMLERYKPESDYDRKNALKEVLQEIALVGLCRLGFFENVAFYGGTALRMFYGLDRFSEDLDFSLKSKYIPFKLEKFLPSLEREMNMFGVNVSIEAKEKKLSSPIKAAFIRGNTREYFMNFYECEKIAKTDNIKIRLEVDITPPDYAGFEYRDMWTPFSNMCRILLYDEPSLFAGKVHAVLDRKWQNRLKGRDLYDYVFYLTKRKSKINLKHLLARLQASGFIAAGTSYTLEDVKKMLCKKFDDIDFSLAREDVYAFIKDSSTLERWDSSYFKNLTQELKEN